MHIQLSTLAIILGLVLAVPHLFALAKPAKFAAAARKFPRSLPWGIALMLLGTAWFVYNLSVESLSDFVAYRNALFIAFAAIGIATCIYVQDFLAVRGLAVVMLLVAKLMVDTARWVETDWRLVIVVMAYLWVIAGMWFTLYPWHLRDLLNFATANEKRVRIFSAIRVAFGLLLVVLGVTVFRGA